MTGPREVDLLVDGGLVVTMDRAGTVLEEGAVAVEAGEIVAVGEAEDLRGRYRPRERIDARGHLAMPGLVNAHVHMGDALFRGLVEDLPLEPWLERLWAAERRFVTSENVRRAVRLAVAEMMRGGTTTALDMFWFPEAAAEVAREAGFRVVTGPVLFDPEGPDGLSPPERLARGREFLQAWRADPLVLPCVQPHNGLTVSPERMREARSLADEFGVLLHTHASETAAEVEESRKRFGATPVAHLEAVGALDGPAVLAHCVHLTDEDVQILRRRGAAAVHNPLSNLKLGSGIAPLPRLEEAGVPVLLGTDGPVSSNDLDMWTAMRFAALLQRGVHRDPTLTPARRIVEMATRRGAEGLGLGERIGSLEPGKRADLILVELRRPHLTPLYDVFAQLVFAAGRDDVAAVVIDGRVVARDGELLTVDVERAVAEVREVAAEISAFSSASSAD